MIKCKKRLAILMALSLSITCLIIFIGISRAFAYAGDGRAADSTPTDAEKPALAVPENLRYEDGDIAWDDNGAYGYELRARLGGDSESVDTYLGIYYDTRVELDRLCYERNWDFGEYTFAVRAFDEARNYTAYSRTVTAEYAPTMDAPANVTAGVSVNNYTRITWDEVPDAYRYNLCIFKDGDERPSYNRQTISSSDYYYWNNLSGDYWISVQAMDLDYSVSPWTEPVKFSYVKIKQLAAPQNVRLDESGENIIWDEVEGARGYNVYIPSDRQYEGKYGISFERPHSVFLNLAEANLSNWKSYVCPLEDDWFVYVHAHGEGFDSSDWSGLSLSYEPACDETIELPESLTRRRDEYGDRLEWMAKEDIAYFLHVKLPNGKCRDGRGVLSSCYIPMKSPETIGYYVSMIPEGNYEVELVAVDKSGKYNKKTYPITLDTPHDDTIWVPKIFHKFDRLLWDFDELRHDNTDSYWIRIKDTKDDDIIWLINEYRWYAYFDGLTELPNGEYTVEVCVYEYGHKLGPWVPIRISKHDDGLFDKENESTTEMTPPPEAADIPEEDRITSITINPAFNMKNKNDENVELDLSKIKIKAEEIYDEAGLKRVEEALGQEIKKNQHYNLLDLTLLYNEKDFSNGYQGLVQVVIPIPAGHRDKTFSCYRLTEVDGKMTKEVIEGEQTEDSYIIYLEHFSEYALVGTAVEAAHTLEKHDAVAAGCTTPGKAAYWTCTGCGAKFSDESGTDEIGTVPEIAAAGHAWDDGVITTPATVKAEGVRTFTCKVCKDARTESVPRLVQEESTPTDPASPVEFTDRSTNIMITAPAGAFDKEDGVRFEAVSVIGKTDVGKFTFDLTFTDKNGTKVQPKAAVTVKIPVPASLIGKSLYVYHAENNGGYTEISCNIENGMVVFNASKFSEYIVTDKRLAAANDNPGSAPSENAGQKPADSSENAGQKPADSSENANQKPADGATAPATGIAAPKILILAAASASFLLLAIMGGTHMAKKKRR